MKWFKHLANSTNDNLIFEAIERFGGDGYLVFFAVLEILADEFDISNPGICQFSVKKLRKNCQISGKKLAKILNFFNEKAEKNAQKGISFYVQFEGSQLIVSCPKFKRLTDDYTRKKTKAFQLENPDIVRTKSSKVPRQQQTTEEEEDKSNNPAGQNGPPVFFEKNNMGGALSQIKNKCERIEQLKKEIPKEINILAWIQDKINCNGHPAAIIESLDMLIARWPTVDLPWAYATAIFQLKNGNYWETEHIEQSKEFKKEWQTNGSILELIKGIGAENPDDEKICF
jgi:hypothetical protein